MQVDEMVSKKQAAEIAMVLYGSRKGIEYVVTEAADQKISIYGNYDWSNLWLVSVSGDINESMLGADTIVLIQKDTGEVVYHGKT